MFQATVFFLQAFKADIPQLKQIQLSVCVQSAGTDLHLDSFLNKVEGDLEQR